MRDEAYSFLGTVGYRLQSAELNVHNTESERGAAGFCFCKWHANPMDSFQPVIEGDFDET